MVLTLRTAPKLLTLSGCRRFHLDPVCAESGLAAQFKKATEGARHPFRTKQSDPTLHTSQHEGLFYTLDPAEASKWLAKGQFKHVSRMVKAFGEASLMVRTPALQVFNYISHYSNNMPVIRCVLYGANGSGKTTTLAHVMHHCSNKGWLVVHIPYGAIFTKFPKDFQLSTTRPGRVDQPVDSAEWLSYFRMINSNFFKANNPTVEGSYTWTKREKAEPGTPWLEIIDFALGRPKYASDIINVLMKEIKQQTSEKRFQTLFAVDGVNAFWEENTVIKREDNPRLKYAPDDLSVVHNFKKLLKNDWTNGVVICSVDNNAAINKDLSSYLPRFLLGKHGFEWLDPFLPVHVPTYSDKEIHSCLEYYLDRQWITNPKGATMEGKEELKFISAHNPWKLYETCSLW